MGVIGLFLFAFFALLSVELSALGLILVVGSFLFVVSWRGLAREPVFIGCVVFALFVILNTLWSVMEFPSDATPHVNEALRWLRFLLFVCVAWFLTGKQERVRWLLLLAAGGLLVKLFFHEDWLRLDEVLSGSVRTGFGYGPVLGAFYVASLILGLVLFAPHMIVGPRGVTAHYLLRGLGWFAFLCVLLVVLIAAQSRSAWLAAILVIPPVLLMRYRSALSTVKAWAVRHWISLLAALGIVGSLSVTGLMYVTQRTLGERQEIEMILSGEADQAPRSSASYRYDLLRFGLEKWSERIWFGWGPEAPRLLVARSNRPELVAPRIKRPGMAPYRNLHNTYIELLVRFGIVGTLIFSTVIGLLLHGVWRAYRRKIMSQEYALFVLGAFGLTIVWSLFNYDITKLDWQNYFILLSAVAYSFRLRPKGSRVVTGRAFLS